MYSDGNTLDSWVQVLSSPVLSLESSSGGKCSVPTLVASLTHAVTPISLDCYLRTAKEEEGEVAREVVRGVRSSIDRCTLLEAALDSESLVCQC